MKFQSDIKHNGAPVEKKTIVDTTAKNETSD